MKKHLPTLLKNRLPKFIQRKYDKFAAFIYDYYTWANEKGNFLEILTNWEKYNAFEDENTFFTDRLFNELGFKTKSGRPISPQLLLQFLRDFFLSKGSADSYKLLFKLLYDEKVEINYPRDDLLWLSEAEYEKEMYIYTTNENVGTPEFTILQEQLNSGSVRVIGNSSKNETTIQEVNVKNGYVELRILDVVGDFIPGEPVSIEGDVTVNETLLSLVQINIIESGHSYDRNDKVTIKGADISGIAFIEQINKGGVEGIDISDGGKGYVKGDRIYAVEQGGFTARVNEVDSEGAITEIKILSTGHNFETIPKLKPLKASNRINLIPEIEDSQLALQDTPNPPKISILGEYKKEEVPITDGNVAQLKATSTTIGGIKSIGFKSPYIVRQTTNINSRIQVHVEGGEGFTYNITLATIFTKNSWNDTKGILGISSTTLDSDKYQVYSYQISTNVYPSLYNHPVNHFLHPVGFKKFNNLLLPGSSSIIEVELVSSSIDLLVEITSMVVYSGIHLEYFEIDFAGSGENTVLGIIPDVNINTKGTFGGKYINLTDEQENNLLWG